MLIFVYFLQKISNNKKQINFKKQNKKNKLFVKEYIPFWNFVICKIGIYLLFVICYLKFLVYPD